MSAMALILPSNHYLYGDKLFTFMIKNFLGIIFICFFFIAPAQTLHDAYFDGKVYLKVHPNLLLANKQENPRNISLKSLDFLSPLISKYGISKVDRPFFTATDDADLPYVLRIEFSKIEKVNSLIQELSHIRGVVYAEQIPLMKTDATPSPQKAFRPPLP